MIFNIAQGVIVQLDAVPSGVSRTLTNTGESTLYYGSSPNTSATVNAGSIAPGASAATTLSPLYVASPSKEGEIDDEPAIDSVGSWATDASKVISLSRLPSSVGNASAAYLAPSGDTTGATDTAAINEALSTNARVVLRGVPGGTPFWINAPMVINAGNSLILWDAHVKLVANANCNLLTNYNATLTSGTQNYGGTADTLIRVKGIGEAWLDGNPANQAAAFVTGNTTTQAGIQWVNAADVVVEDIKLGPCIWMAGVQIGCTKMRWSRIELGQDRSVTHQDGIDVGPGCSDILIEHTRGMTSDDCHSLWAKLGPSSGAANVTPWTTAAYTASPTNLNTSDVRIIGTKVAVGINCVRAQAGDGAQLSDVHISDFVKVGALYSAVTCALQLGSLIYVTTPPQPTDLHDITFDGFTGECVNLIGVDSNFSDIHFSNAHVEAPFTALVGNTGTIPTVGDHLTLDNITTSDPVGTANYGMNTIPGASIDHVNIHGLSMKSTKALVDNGGQITGLSIDQVHITAATGPVFSSPVAETGHADRVTVDTASGPTYGTTPVALKLGPNMPRLNGSSTFNGTDTVPVAVAGSTITCNSDLDPTGGAYGHAATYLGDGSVWSRLLELPALTANTMGLIRQGVKGYGFGNFVHNYIVLTVGAAGHAAGSLLVVAASARSAGVVTGVTDSRSNTYTVDKTAGSGNNGVSICSSRLATGLQPGDTITVTYSVTGQLMLAAVAEFAGISASPVDRNSSNIGTSSTSLSAGTTATTTQTTELAVAAFVTAGVATAPAADGSTAGTGFTKLNDIAYYAGGIGTRLIWEYQLLSSEVALNSTATLLSTHAYVGAAVTYK